MAFRKGKTIGLFSESRLLCKSNQCCCDCNGYDESCCDDSHFRFLLNECLFLIVSCYLFAALQRIVVYYVRIIAEGA